VFDTLGRNTKQIHQDKSQIQWCYDGVLRTGQTNCKPQLSCLNTGAWVDFSDETGKNWQRASDALGRLSCVLEPDKTNSPTTETDYPPFPQDLENR
jgi:hypothetical protein